MYPPKDILYVGIQFLLLSVFLINKENSLEIPYAVRLLGLVLSVLGALVVSIAIIQLSKSLSPFPTPKQNGHLVTNGLYHYVRHPIYTGIIFGTMGISLYQGSMTLMITSLLLVVLFYFKARYEERLLAMQYPTYYLYQQNTKMLIPFLL
jgi:protein-S-isoprenylcysteine O-methyltransferase Ste14